MKKPPTLVNEQERLQELHSLNLLDTDDEESLDTIVRLASHVTGCPVSLISLVDSDRQWFKAKIGTEVRETPRDISFCGHTIEHNDMLVVENALDDERFSDNPLVIDDPNIRFYAGHPLITKNGFKIGTLCTIDLVPRKLTDEQKSLLAALAKQAMYLIEKRLTELKSETTKKNLRILFEKSHVIVAFMKGPDHEFEYVNPAHVRLINGVNATGKKVCEVQPEAEGTGLLKLLDDVYGDGATFELRDTPFLIGNTVKHFDFIFTPSFGYDGKIDGVMAIVNDITAIITSRDEISKSVESLEEERDLRERFVAALSHDLRTPLTAAKMSAQLLDRKLDEGSRKLTSRIINSMDRADDMIRDLLDASKIKAGEKFSLHLQACNLTELAQETIEDLITIHGNRFQLELQKNIHGFWDIEFVRRILENLASNAIKYGSISTPVMICTKQNGNSVELLVQNRGNPIPEAEKMSLFEPYKRSANSGSQKGWGIGLTLVRGFSEALGGRVSVTSSEKDGTIFSVNLPEDSRKSVAKKIE
jgi:signal transduction histidine kinase